MPIYEYACGSCGHRFEARQGFYDDPLSTCPECTGEIRRVVHPAGVIFKGSGWYSTDNRSDSGFGDNGRTDTSKSPAATKSESKSEVTTTEKAAADD